METLYKKPGNELTEGEKTEILHWARLIGKVAQSQSIREKLFSINLHELTLAKLNVFKELSGVNNVAFMFGNFTREYDRMASWLMEKQVPEIIM